MASVKVAVRVRPFNQRELNMNTGCIIAMDDKKTRILNSKFTSAKQDGESLRERYKDFTFDFSYWSFAKEDSHFVNQEKVFNDLGIDVVDNAFEGYNACVFAYGQTSSGKTHTMMGGTTVESQGLIPRICKDMFNRMVKGKEKGTTYRTEVSYLEIYNERVKDLLKRDQTHSLKVREHPKQGPYVEDLSKHLVMEYNDILELMSRGNANRTTASTNMNDVSSRSHAIFTMTFVQASFVGDMPSETVSKVHLVDLAGSERVDATGATGKRLKEGAHINKSLVTLGSVISALADSSQSQKKPFIPYRDSVLTWLLKDSLGGNSKTIMIATISPAECNYSETLSTLRYANRAKNIINKPTINEDSNVKLIKELRAEISKLKAMLGETESDTTDVLAELMKKEAKEKVLTEEWTEKWKETKKILMEQKDLALRKAGAGVVLDSQMPHLIGIDDDLLSTGITLLPLKEGETKIGSGQNENEVENHITLCGQGLENEHCSIMLKDGVATLVPLGCAPCVVNGQPIDKPTRLFQGCVIMLGRSTMFRYNDPAEAEKLRREGSKNLVNLSRLSFLSRSATDLAVTDPNVAGEENALLEEKRKQLEAEEARLQKESKELMNQKKLLEEQRNMYQQLQQEKEEAWKAEQLNKSAAITFAQKELEEKREKLEQEYAAHRKRLSDDWKRLEQQEQETLSSLQTKEKDLKKRREYLEWEIDQEMQQIEKEAVSVESLRSDLEKKEKELDSYVEFYESDLKSKYSFDEPLKKIVDMNESAFEQFLAEQSNKLETWNASSRALLESRKKTLEEQFEEISNKMQQSNEKGVLEALTHSQEEISSQQMDVGRKLNSLESTYCKSRDDLEHLKDSLSATRNQYESKREEFKELENEIDKGIDKMMSCEDKMTRLESELALITDQEKLIVSQLAHIDTSKQKLLTIIEGSSEPELDGLNDKKILKLGLKEDEDKTDTPTTTSTISDSTEHLVVPSPILSSSPKNQENKTRPPPNVSPIIKATKDMKNNSEYNTLDPAEVGLVGCNNAINAVSFEKEDEEIINRLRKLVDKISEQKNVVLECLENDCDKEELNSHIAVLQKLRSHYLELRCSLQDNKHECWLTVENNDAQNELFQKTDSNHLVHLNEDELDDSETHSSATDHDDHIQLLIEQGVERRLRQIFDQIRAGQRPDVVFNQSRQTLRRSLPSGLNHTDGFGSDDESIASLRNGLPRSLSMNMAIWASAMGNAVIPGVLDISIPSFFLRGSGTGTHFQYEVCMVTPLEKWSVLRRYRKFRELYNYMRKKYGSSISTISFPPKNFFRKRSEELARERQKHLEVSFNLIKNIILMDALVVKNTTKVKDALVAFSPFFQKGYFESTKYGTS